MNEFVEECRREWKRLGVPDPVANEMAADLAADLEEAASEGASAEEVLGNGAFDPRSFAASWAAERGFTTRRRKPRRVRLPAAIGAVFALVAIAGAVLVIPDSDSSSSPSRFGLPPPPPLAVTYARSPDGVWVAMEPDRLPTVLVLSEDMADSGVDAHTVGAVLLIVGLAGSVPLMLFWSVAPPRRSHVREDPL